MVVIPKKLEICPLVDAVVEIRFDIAKKMDRNLVSSLIYNSIQDLFDEKVEALPLIQMPDAIRNQDPNLKYKPIYKVSGKNALIQIGPQVVAISSKIPYIGWQTFLDLILKVLNKLKEAGIIYGVNRLGHRFVNFFEEDISDKLTIEIPEIKNYKSLGKAINYNISDENFSHTLQVSNAMQLGKGQGLKFGSIIDIDTARDYKDLSYFMSHLEEELNAAHDKEKHLFYALLKEDFIIKMRPEYE